MTDDKGAGEGPYFHRCGTTGEASNCKACAYEHGRKAERERCAKIVEAVMCVEDDLINGIGKGIVETIKRGGQDAK